MILKTLIQDYIPFDCGCSKWWMVDNIERISYKIWEYGKAKECTFDFI